MGDGLGERVGLRHDLVLLVGPGFRDPDEQIGERRHAVARLGREVGPRVERFERFGLEPDAHGPAAATRERLCGCHVEIVHVRAFLAVDLDADEALVHHLGCGFILEALTLHDVAPVAGRVADREEDGHVSAAGFLESLLAPRPPVDRVLRVLKEIRTRLTSQAVGVHGRGLGLGDCIGGQRTRDRKNEKQCKSHRRMLAPGRTPADRCDLQHTQAGTLRAGDLGL